MTLVGHWPLHERSGQANDLSGNGNHGTVNGATQGVGGVGGLSAYSFDGTDDNVKITSTTIGGSLGSVSVWFNTTDTGTGALVSTGDTGNTGRYFELRVSGGTLEMVHAQEGSEDRVSGNTTVNDGAWHHGAVTSDGASWSLYVDGSNESLSVLGGSNSGDWFGDVVSPDHLTFAYRERNSSDHFFGGEIADVRIYDRVLMP